MHCVLCCCRSSTHIVVEHLLPVYMHVPPTALTHWSRWSYVRPTVLLLSAVHCAVLPDEGRGTAQRRGSHTSVHTCPHCTHLHSNPQVPSTQLIYSLIGFHAHTFAPLCCCCLALPCCLPCTALPGVWYMPDETRDQAQRRGSHSCVRGCGSYL